MQMKDEMRARRRPPALAFVGPSGSGKTTLVEAMIALFSARSYRIGAIKSHTKCAFEVDKPGKDSYRFTQAGSCQTLVSAPGKLALMKQLDHEPDFVELLSYMEGCDLVLAEGYRHAGLPTLEIVRSGNESLEELALRVHHFRRLETRAVLSDYAPELLAELAPGVPVIDLNDREAIFAFICEFAYLDEGGEA